MCKFDVLAGLAEMKDDNDHAVVNQHDILYSFFKRSGDLKFCYCCLLDKTCKGCVCQSHDVFSFTVDLDKLMLIKY